MNHSRRLAYLGVVAVVTPLGFATKLYAGPGAAWVGGYLGGFFYVLFFSFVILSLAPEVSPARAAAVVLAITCVLEFLQLWHPPLLERIRASFLGRALIGSTFSWGDFVYYGLGALAAPVLARCARSFAGRASARRP